MGTAYTILSGVTHPTSRGRITLTGPEVSDPPEIDPAYLSTDHDRRLVRRALELARRWAVKPRSRSGGPRRFILALTAAATRILVRFSNMP